MSPGPAFAAGFFVGRRGEHGEDRQDDTARPRGPRPPLVHGGTLRSQFGETSEAIFLTQGYRLRHRRGGRGALQGRGARLHLFALRQPDRRHVRGAHAPPRRRRGRARHGERHGGGHRGLPLPSARPATTSSRRRRCSAPAATWSRTCCRATASPRRWSTARDLGQWEKAVTKRKTKAVLPGEPDQPDARGDRHRRRRRARPQGRRAARSSTTSSPRRCCRSRSSSAPTSSSIRRPSTSTARAAASAASSWPTRNSSPTICTPSSARPARRSARSTPGCCSRAWRRCALRVERADGERAARSPIASPANRKVTPRPLSRPRRPSAGRHRSRRQMTGGSSLIAFEVEGGKAGGLRVAERAEDHPHLQQSRRRQEPDHPPRDHHPPAPQRRGPPGARHHAGTAAALGRAGGLAGPRRRSGERAVDAALTATPA